MNIGLIKYLKLHGYTQIFSNNKIHDINNIVDQIDIQNLKRDNELLKLNFDKLLDKLNNVSLLQDLSLNDLSFSSSF